MTFELNFEMSWKIEMSVTFQKKKNIFDDVWQKKNGDVTNVTNVKKKKTGGDSG